MWAVHEGEIIHAALHDVRTSLFRAFTAVSERLPEVEAPNKLMSGLCYRHSASLVAQLMFCIDEKVAPETGTSNSGLSAATFV